ncbi:uracil-DNA glycosylase family protein [Flavobacterium sp.]|uniref:uracil-DNA glycosylase family protein n=1 Tax=Flavobacterium sp. TaxID=239 RepID=UPI002489D5F9|nr:uracil-DNA glycosylase family protein [Flavobacterium sp.]MDI1315763.1 hypothetical protein [Flavobacterium sp.]
MNLLGHHRDAITALLINNIINFKEKEELLKYYELLENYTSDEDHQKKWHTEKINLKDIFLNLHVVQKSKNAGIDLPVLLQNNSATKTIMVCGMDPRSDQAEDTKVVFWAPFSIIKKPEQYIKSDKSNLAFFDVLTKSYNLYVTDIYKLFFRYNGKVSNTIREYTELKVHAEVLLEEIKIIKPEFIVTLGNASKDALNTILSKHDNSILNTINIDGATLINCNIEHHFKVINLPHISGLAIAAKKRLLDGKELIGKSSNEKLGNFVCNIVSKL